MISILHILIFENLEHAKFQFNSSISYRDTNSKISTEFKKIHTGQDNLFVLKIQMLNYYKKYINIPNSCPTQGRVER